MDTYIVNNTDAMACPLSVCVYNQVSSYFTA